MANISTMKAELDETQDKCQLLAMHHRKKSISQLTLNRRLGVAVTIITVFIGPSAISSAAHFDNININFMNYVTGALSLLAAALSGTQTILNPAQSSQEHKDASDGYSSLEDRITIWKAEYVLEDQSTSSADSDKAAFQSFEQLLEEFGQVTEQAPTIDIQF